MNTTINKKRAVMIITPMIVLTALFIFRPRLTPVLAPTEKKPLIANVEDSLRTGPEMIIGGEKIQVTLADTPALREQGLSGKKNLGNNEGMLFIFQNDSQPGFWMKDMNFPIDIIWIDASWKVVDITKDLAPETYPEAFFPKKPIRYVVEVPAGFSTHRVMIGDKVLFEE